MSRRLLCMVACVCALGWSRVAAADVDESPDPLVVGAAGVAVGQQGSVDGTLTESSGVAETVASFDLTAAGCTPFAITTPPPITVVIGLPQSITATFTPTANGAASCVVTMRDAGAAALGTFTLQGNGLGPVIGATPSPLPAGSVAVGSTVTPDLTINNSGNADLTIAAGGLTIAGGTAPGDFSVAGATLPLTIAAGDHATIPVAFTPSAGGSRTATLSIASNDPVTPTLAVNLTGTGLAPSISVTSVAFGVVNDGQTSDQAISISNLGTGTLHVTEEQLTQSDSWFTMTACGAANPCSDALTATSTTPASFTVRCAPPTGATGTQTATVTFTSDSDTGGGNVSMLACTAGRPDVSIDNTTLAFGSEAVGTPSAPLTATLTNNGNVADLYSVSLSGAGASQYAITGCTSGCSLGSAGGTATLSVVYTPTATGPAGTATITITSTTAAFAIAPITVSLSGTGTAPVATLEAPSSGSLTFGTIEIGAQSTPQTITVQNTGTAPLQISSATLTAGTTANYLPVSGTGAQTVPAGGTASWSITCAPQAQGSVASTFTIASNGVGTSSIAVPISCTGAQGALAVTPSTTAFGQVRVGNEGTQTFTFKNTGNEAVTGITATFDVTTDGYKIDATTPVPTTLAAGASTTIQLDFTPTTTALGGNANLTFTGKWGAAATVTTAVEAITGQGLTTGYQLFPNPLAFGNVRFDAPTSLTLSIRNNNPASFSLQAPQIASTGTTTVGTFTLGAIVEHGTTTPVTFPHTMAANEQIDCTVTVTPGTQLGALTGQVTTTSDLPTNPNQSAQLTATSTTAVVAFEPASALVDFGAVDVEAALAATQSIIVDNTGSAPLDILSFTNTNPDNAFSFTLPAPQTIAPGDSLAIPVSYLPLAEGMDTTNLVLQLHGALVAGGELTTATVTVQGSGLDRNISVPPMLTFAPTFRNPGPDAPTMPATIMNTGNGVLHVTGVTLTGDAAFALAPGTPTTFDVAAGATMALQVVFDPTAIGNFTGDLALTNDTSSARIAHVMLSGAGVGRDVNVGPTPLNLGTTGVQVPISLADRGGLITVQSLDMTQAFTVRKIELSGDAEFTLDDPPTDAKLAPLATNTYNLTFTPERVGDFTAKVSIFLDDDPVAQAVLPVTGQAVDVDIHGGGGCAAGGSNGGGGAAGALLAIAALAIARRRRGAIVVLALAVAARAAAADPTRNLDLSDFDPTPATVGDTFALQSPFVGHAGDWAAGAVFSYATNPLRVDGAGMTDTPITQRSTIVLGGAYAFKQRYEVSIRLPLFDQNGDAPQFSGITPPTGSAIGDLTLAGKMMVWRGHDFAIGAAAELALPTATSNQFAGVGDPTGRLQGLATWTRDRLAVDANLGAVLRAPSSLGGIEQGSGMIWGAALSYRVLPQMWVSAELFGELDLGVTSMMEVSPIEILGGAHYRVDPRVTIGIAVGRGLVDGLGAPDLRGVFTMAFVPGGNTLPVRQAALIVDGDRDGDGIPDSVDKCPDQPEDKDGFQDADGCPDLDNDNDGIPDITDQCPNVPEDKDGFQDADGCPDPDNDNDGIPDTADKCPNEPEDKDGFQDADGCPDPDNDNDGIPDARDKCPNQPETINGYQDEDGCPDKGDSLVILSPDRLEILEPVKFIGNSAKIAKASFNLLGQVGATLRAHKEIVRLRITVHAQPHTAGTAAAKRDQELTDKRAAAIRDWLVQWGLATGRLEPRGFGGDRPLVDPAQAGAAAINERVELIILERK